MLFIQKINKILLQTNVNTSQTYWNQLSVSQRYLINTCSYNIDTRSLARLFEMCTIIFLWVDTRYSSISNKFPIIHHHHHHNYIFHTVRCGKYIYFFLFEANKTVLKNEQLFDKK